MAASAPVASSPTRESFDAFASVDQFALNSARFLPSSDDETVDQRPFEFEAFMTARRAEKAKTATSNLNIIASLTFARPISCDMGLILINELMWS